LCDLPRQLHSHTAVNFCPLVFERLPLQQFMTMKKLPPCSRAHHECAYVGMISADALGFASKARVACYPATVPQEELSAPGAQPSILALYTTPIPPASFSRMRKCKWSDQHCWGLVRHVSFAPGKSNNPSAEEILREYSLMALTLLPLALSSCRSSTAPALPSYSLHQAE